MTVTGRGGVLVMVVVMVVMMGSPVHGDETSRNSCQQPRGDCRLKTQSTDGLVSRNVSCYCKYGEEVSHHLERLTHANCMNAFGEQVNISILHIVGCNVTSQAPVRSFLSTFRETSNHLELYVERSDWLSLASPSRSSHRTPNIITATFINSNVSGMPEGVVGGARVSANVVMEGGKVGVLETRAFSGYPPDAQVTVSFRGTTILTVQEGAFDLPPEAQVDIRNGQVLKFQPNSYSGGSELTLDSLRGVILLPSAINIYGFKKLSVTNCSMAGVYYHALHVRPPTYIRNITLGDTLMEGSEAIISDNKFQTGNGQAFAQLCSVAKVTWHNNTILTTNDMPFRIQAPECRTPRNWPLVFSNNIISCDNCTYFANPDIQTCALFATSYCIGCHMPLDGCGEPVLPYITSKCKTSHPDIAKALTDTCDATIRSRTPKALQARESESYATSLTPPALVVTLFVSVMLRRWV